MIIKKLFCLKKLLFERVLNRRDARSTHMALAKGRMHLVSLLFVSSRSP